MEISTLNTLIKTNIRIFKDVNDSLIPMLENSKKLNYSDPEKYSISGYYH